ncbi:MAG: glycosyltransferase family 39 protein [Nocardiopsaceae bacterium]|nr:glycosyltransferase family 39 protein [Nocardiopsaceae bacterium]
MSQEDGTSQEVASQDIASLRPGEGRHARRSVFQHAEADTVMFASARALPVELEYTDPFGQSPDPGHSFGTRIRRRRLCRIVLGLILLMQAALTLRMHNTAFEDEALYLYVGHLEIAHLLHGAALPADYPSYFSGAPVLYPVLGAAADNVGGLAGARAVSLLAMLAATALLYGLTRRLFSELIAVCAAIVFAVAEPTLFLGNLATYDATALSLLALAAWLVVASAGTRWPLYALAAPVLALAVATKYAALLWVPGVVVLAGLAAWPHRGRAAALIRPVVLTAITGGLLAAALRYAGTDYRHGITSTTLERAAGAVPASSLLWDCVQWIGLPLLLALAGTVAYTMRPAAGTAERVAPAGSAFRRAVLGIVLTGCALLAPANQIRIHTLVSLQKHVGFGLLLAAPIAGAGLAWLIGDHFRRTQFGIAVGGIALALGMTQANNLFNAWPDSSVTVAQLSRFLRPGGHYLVEVPEVPIYYLREHSGARPGQFSQTFNITFTGPDGRTLTGEAAYAEAIKEGYFTAIAFDYRTTPTVDQAIAHDLAVNSGYQLAAVVPESTGGREYVWVKSG